MTAASKFCPPEHKPVTDDEIAWLVVTLYRDGMGQVCARCVHVRSEGEAHQMGELLEHYGPTWVLDLPELSQQRYDLLKEDR